MHDILLRNALLVDPETGSTRVGDLAVENGRIAEASGNAREVIDCTGLVLQPGIIDTHVHLGIHPAGCAMVARAGVTTALDMAGPAEKILNDLAVSSVGITVGTLQAILPGRNVAGNDPSKAELVDFIEASRQAGALGVKLLGGHFPLTPEASGRMVAAAHELGCYMAWHAGTTTQGSDINGLLQAVELCEGKPLHMPHVNAYCRGRVHEVETECAMAEKLLLDHPELTTESYLSARNGAPLDCDAAGTPKSAVTRSTLERFGFAASADGIVEAVRTGMLAVLSPKSDDIELLTLDSGIRFFLEHSDRCDGSFDGVNPSASRLFFATRRRPDGDFLVDAFSTDGGAIPRNVILEKGMPLVDLGALSLVDFARKSSLNPARMLGLDAKGRLAPGMDADLTIFDPKSAQAVHTIANGRFVLHNRRLVKGRPTLLTTAAGTAAAKRRGLDACEVSGLIPRLHNHTF